MEENIQTNSAAVEAESENKLTDEELEKASGGLVGSEAAMPPEPTPTFRIKIG